MLSYLSEALLILDDVPAIIGAQSKAEYLMPRVFQLPYQALKILIAMHARQIVTKALPATLRNFRHRRMSTNQRRAGLIQRSSPCPRDFPVKIPREFQKLAARTLPVTTPTEQSVRAQTLSYFQLRLSYVVTHLDASRQLVEAACQSEQSLPALPSSQSLDFSYC